MTLRAGRRGQATLEASLSADWHSALLRPALPAARPAFLELRLAPGAPARACSNLMVGLASVEAWAAPDPAAGEPAFRARGAALLSLRDGRVFCGGAPLALPAAPLPRAPAPGDALALLFEPFTSRLSLFLDGALCGSVDLAGWRAALEAARPAGAAPGAPAPHLVGAARLELNGSNGDSADSAAWGEADGGAEERGNAAEEAVAGLCWAVEFGAVGLSLDVVPA